MGKRKKRSPDEGDGGGCEDEGGRDNEGGERDRPQQPIRDLKDFDPDGSLSARDLTIPVALDNVLDCGSAALTAAVKGAIAAASDSLGILSNLVTVYLNAKAEDEPTFPDLLSVTYVSQVFTRMARLPFNSNTSPIDDPFLDAYLARHPLSAAITWRIQSGFLARPRDAISKDKIVEAARRHVIDEFQGRLEAHLSWLVEIATWQWRAEPGFDAAVKSAGRCLFLTACFRDDAAAEAKLRDFLTRPRGRARLPLGPHWAAGMASLAREEREARSHLRTPLPNPGRERDAPQLREYRFNIKNFPHLCLDVMARTRALHAPFRARRGEIWTSINEERPSLRGGVKTRAAARAQRGNLRGAEAPAWLDEGPELLTRDEVREWRALASAAWEARTALWLARQEPGTLRPPRGYTMLPVFKLKPAFVLIDAEVLSVLGTKLRKAAGAADGALRTRRSDRLWWTKAFDLHGRGTREIPAEARRRGKRYVREYAEQRGQAKRGRRARRAVIKTGRKVRRSGLRILRREGWVLDDAAYEAAKGGRRPPPHLVRCITSDGERCHVTLQTLVAARPAGAPELVREGYDAIRGTCVVGRDRRGLFRDVAPLPEELLDCLDAGDRACFVEAIGAADLKGSDRCISGREYRYQSLALRAQRFERERREANAPYRLALENYARDEASARCPGGMELFSRTVYQGLDAVAGEQLSAQRRRFAFARARATDRALAHLARDIAGGDPDAAASRAERRRSAPGKSPVSPRRRELLANVRERLAGGRGRTWTRIVFFGNGQFGSGAAGRLPRKALLKTLAEICCVVLTDEYLTSKTYEDSGAGGRCSVRYLDRDCAGGGNIANDRVDEEVGPRDDRQGDEGLVCAGLAPRYMSPVTTRRARAARGRDVPGAMEMRGTAVATTRPAIGNRQNSTSVAPPCQDMTGAGRLCGRTRRAPVRAALSAFGGDAHARCARRLPEEEALRESARRIAECLEA
ncbi:hypothetical protein JKP88DRAFT_304661 [Tribonema minus]|uniref:Uncharacterized protein n=1 Tax=Tribonema minus TaxID=303371 RepID=A0A835ZC24_9STRA|nr:hypothetical protein JKP88DRAFT_304661 [Tribonema minus]